MKNMVQQPESSISTLTLKERRHVFNDYTPPAPARTNRPFRKRKVSTFNIILSLCLFAVASVLYISNIIAANQLSAEINELKTTYTSLENMNEIIRSEINRKSSMERITKIAAEEMKMVFPKQPPVWLEVDQTILQQTKKN